MPFDAPSWWSDSRSPAPRALDLDDEEKVVPLSRAYPVGLYEDPRTPECEHLVWVDDVIDLHGLPRPLPVERCAACRAVSILPVRENV